MKIPLSYYQSEDVVALAKNLLGKVIVTRINNKLTSGIITETEAYAGVRDKASHAYGGRRTKRTEVMFQCGGYSYVYLCYGVHYLFNVVTGPVNQPHAVLIRGIYPESGQDIMSTRLNKPVINEKHTNGPGKLSKALGITKLLNNKLLTSEEVWLEDQNIIVDKAKIFTGERIGVSYADEDAKLPYRFVLNL